MNVCRLGRMVQDVAFVSSSAVCLSVLICGRDPLPVSLCPFIRAVGKPAETRNLRKIRTISAAWVLYTLSTHTHTHISCRVTVNSRDVIWMSVNTSRVEYSLLKNSYNFKFSFQKFCTCFQIDI